MLCKNTVKCYFQHYFDLRILEDQVTLKCSNFIIKRMSSLRSLQILESLKITPFGQMDFELFFVKKIDYQHSKNPCHHRIAPLSSQKAIKMAEQRYSIVKSNQIPTLNLKAGVFNLQLITTKSPMKPKQSELRQTKFQNQLNDLSIEESLPSQMNNIKSKPHKINIDPTIASFSQNQISTGSLSTKNFKNTLNDQQVVELNLHHKKSRKSNKKKIIEKNIILRSRDRHGKSSRILKNKQALKLKQKQKKALKLKQILKQNKCKQKIIPTAKEIPQIKPKLLKISKTEEKLEKINLDECVDIKMMRFERKQLQKKRDDLLKRQVDDWNYIEKLRSDKRQLRVLSIC